MGILLQSEFIVRILLSGLLGGLIGYERKNRGKEAGLRTHMIVAMASALMMIISKYGFSDIPAQTLGSKGVDPSRIASQIVSGVGFLGAGMIFVQKNTIKGLTTAAGIWATSGIGMAIGAGMYVIGIVTTVFMIITQIVLHKNLKFIKNFVEDHITLIVENDGDVVNIITGYINENNGKIESLEIKELKDGKILSIDIDVSLQNEFNPSELVALLPKDCVKYIKC